MRDITKFIPWCTPIIKYGFMAIVAVGVISLGSAHYELQSSNPLENLSATILGNVYVNSNSIVVYGTFDRKVMCTLTNFSFELRSQDDETISILLGPRHLLKGPKPDNGPGINLPIRFHLKLPENTITTGIWQPIFSGEYLCRKSIFKDMKTIRIVGDSFEVHSELEEPVIIVDDELKMA